MQAITDAMRQYFQSLLVYRISSLTARLSAIQEKLLEVSATMTPDEMDDHLNFLEDLRKLLDEYRV
jgi:hypothetical protein